MRVLSDMFSARVISRMSCKIAPSQRMRLLPLGISQDQGVPKEAKDNDRLETEHWGRIGSNFSHRAATSDAVLPETFAGMC